jgi:hypothetical protein
MPEKNKRYSQENDHFLESKYAVEDISSYNEHEILTDHAK